MNLLSSKFDSPEESGGVNNSLETIELLNEETPVEETLDIAEPKKEKEEAKTEEDEVEIDELKEIEEELKAPEEEDLLEIVTPARRRDILNKYPKIFKDFPYLEKAYYRDQQFTELLPTIQDAREAVEKSKALDQLEEKIMDGDISSVLINAKKKDQEAFYKIADNYLHTLRNVDQQAYYHVLGNVVKDTIITMVREARALGEQGAPLQAAANILNQFVFGSQNFAPPTNLARQVNPQEQDREEKFKQEEQKRQYQRFEGVRDDLQVRADNVLKSTIDQHIDPNGSMTAYVKKNASKDAFESLEDLIGKDTRFRVVLDKLWQKAFQNDFDKDSTDKIKAAYLSKAKTLLPSVIKKARNDALRERVAKEKENDSDKRGPIQPGRSTPPSSGKYKKASDIPKGVSTLDVLMSD